VEEEMRLDRPDERTVAQHLDSLGRVLGSAGSVVTAGSALFGPLKTFAAWLGSAALPWLAGLV